MEGPWFESWGRMVAVHPALSNEDRILITKQLLKACDSNSRTGFIPNQVSEVPMMESMKGWCDSKRERMV